MTRYHGGKNKQGKLIADIINVDLEKNFKCYCEPFCGMLGVYRHISNDPNLIYLAGDTNKSVILMWKKAQEGWTPPSEPVSREEFWTLKSNGESSAEKGFIGCVYAYAGNYFHSYNNFEKRKNVPANNAKKINKIATESVVNRVDFKHGDYTQFSHLRNTIIYCDPPYQNSVWYKDDEYLWKYRPFDHDKFWQWIKTMNDPEFGNLIFVSEYTEPPIPYEIVLDYKARDNELKVRRDYVFKILK
jgi:site-specific DNA-adenine methylase